MSLHTTSDSTEKHTKIYPSCIPYVEAQENLANARDRYLEAEKILAKLWESNPNTDTKEYKDAKAKLDAALADRKKFAAEFLRVSESHAEAMMSM